MSEHSERGLYAKYQVLHNGKFVTDCFVLRPENDQIAREAIAHYATRTPNRTLASHLWEWLYRLERIGIVEGDDED